METVDINSIICNWYTYNATHCRRNIQLDPKNKCNLCSMHKQLFTTTFLLPDSELCEVYKDIHIIPRSYRHLKSVMKELCNDDCTVDIIVKGGIAEEADISESEYITLLSDDSKYYYPSSNNTYPKNCNKTKDVKIVLKKYCENKSVIKYNDSHYCEECYKKLKTVPKLSIALRLF